MSSTTTKGGRSPPPTKKVGDAGKIWYKKIKDELDDRDRKCAQLDPNDVYRRPETDPYSYGSLEEFNKQHPFVPRRDCKYVPPNGASLLKDRYQRFFRNIRSKKQCDLVNGTWSPGSVSRSYRYENGVCWKDKDHAQCSRYEVPMLLRPGHENMINKAGVISQASKKCDADPGCSWVKFKHSYDCVSKKATMDRMKERSTTPPPEMPADVTGAKNIEKFLLDFYTNNRVNNKDVLPPATQELVGTGNRCALKPKTISQPQQGQTNALNVQKQLQLEEEEKKVFGFFSKPKEKIRIKIPNADERIADDDADDEAGPRMVPSLPQSVINMIMKNFSTKEATGEKVTNRGLLAWHSTGSGKTFTAAGVMDAFWKSKRDIIFVSSLDALASNPPSNFHEGLLNIYPDFQKEPFAGRTREESLQRIGAAFEKRGVRFLSFAKLSNRVKKTIESGALKGGDAAVVNKGRRATGAAKKKAASAKKAVPAAATKSGKKSGKKAPKANKAVAVKNPVIAKKTKSESRSPVKRQVSGVSIAKEDFIDLNNTVLIVDEVHNLFRPLPTQKAQHDYLKKQLIDPKRFPGLKMVILSATPGDSIDDVLLLLNMIRDPTHPEIRAPDINDQKSVARFRNEIRGLISYFDMSSDFTRFPQVTENEHVVAPMDPVQFEKYVEAYLKTIKEKKVVDYDKLAKDNQLAKYWAPARKYSNMLFTFDKGMKASEFSSKLPALLEKIRAFPAEKHYVYSAFYDNRNKGWSSQGILAIANMMEQELKYKRFALDEAKFEPVKDLQGKVTGYKITKLPDKRRRFLLVTLKELGGESADGKISSSAGEKLKKMLAVYNHPENRYGEIIHTMLASNAFNEGIDLKAVRHIHFFEPLVTMASDKQTIGRAARFCSHADLDKENGEWSVQVHRYMAQYPSDILLRPKVNTAAMIVPEASGPTEDEQVQITQLEQRILETKKILEEFQQQLEPLKVLTSKSKDTNAYAQKEDLKTKIQFATKQIKADEDAIKSLHKAAAARDKDALKRAQAATRQKKTNKLANIDTDKIKMIDEVIFNESRDRVKELMLVYQCMKEAAVDCKLLQAFHEKSGNKYECAKFDAPGIIAPPIYDFKAKNTSGLNDYKRLNRFFF